MSLVIDSPVKLATPSRYQILSLSGGGYRGLFGATILEKLEQQHGSKIGHHFDLLAGTSIGGIIACALAVRIPAKKIREAFRDNGRLIFSRRWRNALSLGVVGSKYSSAPLIKLINDVLGEHAQTPLSKVEIPLLLPTVDVARASAEILVSGGLDPKNAQPISLLDAALSTSAAPTYFSARRLPPMMLIDGGLIANAPDVVALSSALKRVQLSDVHMLSIGTCATTPAKPVRTVIDSGKLRWLLRHKVFDLTLAVQESLVVDTMTTFLGDRYIRLDATPQPEQVKHLKLDKASDKATETLEALAMDAIDASSEIRVASFFSRSR
jgi:predicted acylesterase/phospholipase RssA